MKRPNVLIILTDQQRFDTIRALGNPIIHTPNLDRLVTQGTSFTSTYTPSPVCVPARNSILSGKYPHRTGCFDNGDDMVRSEETLPHVMQNAGYRTHAIGKMHFTPDPLALRGFHSRESQEVGALDRVQDDDYVSYLHANGFNHVHDPYGPLGDMFYIPQPAQMPAHFHGTQWVGDRTLDFLANAGDDEPFFLFTSFFHPHPPFSPPTPWNKLYRSQLLPYPKRPVGYEYLQTFATRYFTHKYYMGKATDDNLLRTIKAYYYACISFVDFQVGRILDALENAGKLDNTMVVFMSDHGEMLGDYGCLTKCSMLDSSARVPLIVRYPEQFDKGVRSDTPVSLVDIMPTALAACEIDRGALDLDGENLSESTTGRDRMVYSQYAHQANGLYMVLNKRWKYVYSAPDRKEFLFDRVEDPDETRNLAGASLRASALSNMRSEAIGRFKGAGYLDPIDGDSWRLWTQPRFPDEPGSDLAIHDVAWTRPLLDVPGYSRD